MPKYLVTHTLTFEVKAKDPDEAEEMTFPLEPMRCETWDTNTEEINEDSGSERR